MSDNANGGEGNQNVDPTRLQERIAQLESSYNRVLNESKDYKTKFSEARSRLEEYESETVNKSGDLQKKLELLEKKAKLLEEENRAKANKLLDQNIKSTISKFAKDAHSIDDIINDKEIRELIQSGIDRDSFSLSEDVAKEAVAKAFEKKPYLKKQVVSEGIDTTRPNAKAGGVVDFSKMTSKEIEAHIKANKLT